MTRIPAVPRIPPRLARWLFYYPFTFAGTLLLGVCFALLGSGLAQRNPFALFLAFLGLSLLAVLAVSGRLQAARAARSPLHWDSSATLVARRPDAAQSLHGEPARLFPFFRHHFSLSGVLTVGREAALRVVREVAFGSRERRHSASGAQPVALYLPLCGLLSCKGRFAVRDLFGLTSSRYGLEAGGGSDTEAPAPGERRLVVQPASWPPKGIPPIDPSVGLEEKSRRRSSDEEKYYMREYAPGDRFRDINWKVSSRLDELITRISPLTQERTTVLEVAFRNFRDPVRETAESLAHLNVLKSWLVSFLRRMKADHPEVQFQVQTAAASRLLQAEEDIDRFAWELAGEFYAREATAASTAAADGQLFVFSTPFDRGLARFMAANMHSQVHLFRTAFARREAAGANGAEPLRLLGDPLQDLPGRWVLRREPKAAGVAASTPTPRRGSLTEEAFAVRVF